MSKDEVWKTASFFHSNAPKRFFVPVFSRLGSDSKFSILFQTPQEPCDCDAIFQKTDSRPFAAYLRLYSIEGEPVQHPTARGRVELGQSVDDDLGHDVVGHGLVPEHLFPRGRSELCFAGHLLL